MYIKLTNPGSFDVVTAISMIGASVKETNAPIGLYGSGVKYALAQCLRQGVEITFVGDSILRLTSVPQVFRGKTFDTVALRSNDGTVSVTGITSDFGKEDWGEPWFIFREFYSNMLDEGGTASLSKEILPPKEGEFSVYLPLNKFRDIWENIPKYFTDMGNNTLIAGTGRIFKRGVYVGKFDFPFDARLDDVRITESRTIDRWDCFATLSDLLRDNPSEHHCKLLHGNGVDLLNLSVPLGNWWGMLHDHWMKIAPNYLLVPKESNAISDARYAGFVPVTIPSAFDCYNLATFNAPDFIRSYFREMDPGAGRLPTPKELDLIEGVLASVKQLGFRWDHPSDSVRVIKSGVSTGTANRVTGIICISEDLLSGYQPKKLLSTMIHEVGHLVSGAADNTRQFTDCFVDALMKILI